MRHKISCAVHDPTPGRCDCGAKTDLQLAQEEIERLHRRAAVSDRNEFGEVVFKRPDQYIHSLEEKVKSLRQRVEELETEIKTWTLEARELHRTIVKLHNEYRPEVEDAERYRWMRENWYSDREYCGEAFDAAIDAAMEAEK